jgi:hypothetical protein
MLSVIEVRLYISATFSLPDQRGITVLLIDQSAKRSLSYVANPWQAQLNGSCYKDKTKGRNTKGSTTLGRDNKLH